MKFPLLTEEGSGVVFIHYTFYTPLLRGGAGVFRDFSLFTFSFSLVKKILHFLIFLH